MYHFDVVKTKAKLLVIVLSLFVDVWLFVAAGAEDIV